MNEDVALFWITESVKLSAIIAAPILGLALAIGLLVSLFQAVTSIQEMTLTYIPKIVVVGAVMLFLAPWMIEMMTDFIRAVIAFLPNVST